MTFDLISKSIHIVLGATTSITLRHQTSYHLSKYSSMNNNRWHRHTFMVVFSSLVIVRIKSILSQLSGWLSGSLHQFCLSCMVSRSDHWTEGCGFTVYIIRDSLLPIDCESKTSFLSSDGHVALLRSLSMYRMLLRNLPWGSISEKYIKPTILTSKAAVQSLRGRLHVGKTLNMIPRVQLSTMLLSYGGIQELKSVWNFHSSSDTGPNWN